MWIIDPVQPQFVGGLGGFLVIMALLAVWVGYVEPWLRRMFRKR